MSDDWILGVDIGGTNLVVGVVPLDGRAPLAMRSARTGPERGADAAVEDVVRLSREVVEEASASGRQEVIGVGIGCPGPLDLEDGVIIQTPNLNWDGFPIRDTISGALDLPAVLDNDANCAAYAEWWQGAGKGSRTMLGVTLGTGIGGGLIMDGRVVHGASGAAGELGHTTIDFSGRRCKCGNYGCLEAYASGPNIAARAREGIEAGYESVLPSLVDGDLERITAQTVYDALVLGDSYALDVITETAKLLGVGIANVINLINPDRVVLVGGVTRAGDHLLGPLRSEVKRRAFDSAVAACEIRFGELTESAGVVGAAGVFRSQHEG